MSCGVGHRCGLDLVWLWLWRRPLILWYQIMTENAAVVWDLLVSKFSRMSLVFICVHFQKNVNIYLVPTCPPVLSTSASSPPENSVPGIPD